MKAQEKIINQNSHHTGVSTFESRTNPSIPQERDKRASTFPPQKKLN